MFNIFLTRFKSYFIQYWFLLFIFILGFLARGYRLRALMPFIGDQAWFYAQARDILIFHKIPLVGITSSHVWLHQGPLWTYLLSGVLWIFSFKPIGGAYFTIFLDSLTIFLIYKIVLEVFSQKRAALAAGILYATSPLIILYSRMPYHTTLIPFFLLLLFFAISRWIKGRSGYFIISLFILAVLYNLELATVIFIFIFVLIFLLGFFKKKIWALQVLNFKMLSLGFIAFLFPMLPMMIYDFKNDFLQTFGFLAWIFYRTYRIILISAQGGNSLSLLKEMLIYLTNFINKLTFISSQPISVLVFLTSIVWLIFKIIKPDKSSKRIFYFLLILFIFIPLFFILANKVASEAYLSMLIPGLIIGLALFFADILSFRKGFYLYIFLIFVFGGLNIFYLIKNNYLINQPGGYGPAFYEREDVAKKIISLANNKQYNIIGRGAGSEFESFTENYKYLTWYLGKPVSNKKEQLIFVVEEIPGKRIILSEAGK